MSPIRGDEVWQMYLHLRVKAATLRPRGMRCKWAGRGSGGRPGYLPSSDLQV